MIGMSSLVVYLCTEPANHNQMTQQINKTESIHFLTFTHICDENLFSQDPSTFANLDAVTAVPSRCGNECAPSVLLSLRLTQSRARHAGGDDMMLSFPSGHIHQSRTPAALAFVRPLIDHCVAVLETDER